MLNTFDPQVLAIAQALQGLVGGQRVKGLPSTTPTTIYGHGPGGLLSAPGLSRQVVNAMILPHLGLQSLLPSYPSMDANPLYGILTGVTATTGTISGANSAGVCEDPPYAGLMKLCTQSYVFGRQSLMTRVFELDRIGKWTNRGEFGDLELVGNPFTNQNGNIAPSIPGGMDINRALRNEVAKAMFELQTAWLRDYARFIYTANPTNNSGGGAIKEYRGLDGLINTGYRDAETGTACAAADSIVSSFQNRNITTQTSTIVQTITGIMRRLWFNANEMGLAPTRWVLAMRWSLFYELTELWPCAYATYRCQNNFSTSQVNYIDNNDMMRLRDEMRGDWDNRTGQYLLIDGVKVPVVIDDAITETGLGTGAYHSPIYFVPLTVRGGVQATYMEYFPYEAAMEAARALAPADSFFATDNNRFLWHKKPPANFCVQALVKSEPRLILRTPQLAARLTNIAYTPSFHEREPFTDSTYFVNGGKTDRLGYSPSYFSPNSNVG